MDLTLNELVAAAGAVGGAALVTFRLATYTVARRYRAFYVAAGAAVGAAAGALAAAVADAIK